MPVAKIRVHTCIYGNFEEDFVIKVGYSNNYPNGSPLKHSKDQKKGITCEKVMKNISLF